MSAYKAIVSSSIYSIHVFKGNISCCHVQNAKQHHMEELNIYSNGNTYTNTYLVSRSHTDKGLRAMLNTMKAITLQYSCFLKRQQQSSLLSVLIPSESIKHTVHVETILLVHIKKLERHPASVAKI